MDSRDRAALQDLLRCLDASALGEGARLRWTQGSALALLLARWSTAEGRLRPMWIDAPSEAEAQHLAADLAALMPDAGVAHFPGLAPYAGGESSPPGAVLRDRMAALAGLVEGHVQVLVTGPLAARESLPHPSWFAKRKLELRKNAELPREILLETLIDLGYRRADLASQPGEFSARGLVIDLWPDHLDLPLRLETFGDELERLSVFDPETQHRTGEDLASLTLYPRFEGDRGQGDEADDALRAILDAKADLTPEPQDDLGFRQARLLSHGHFPGEELFYPLLPHAKGQLAHFVPPCLRVKLDEAWEAALAEQELARISEAVTVLRRGGVVCPDPEDRFAPSDPSRATLHLTEWQAEATVPFTAQKAQEFQGRLRELADEARRRVNEGWRVRLLGSTSGMRDRLRDLMLEQEVPEAEGTAPGCAALHLNLSGGVAIPEAKLLLLTEREAFGRRAIPSTPSKSKSAAFLSDLRDLKPGDRVVHLDHGIGEFLGFAIQKVGDEELEVIQLRYADGGRVGVSLERADLIQKFVSADGVPPPLDKLGGQSWVKVKRRAKKAIRDMAEELLKLYARRKLEKGTSCGPDGPDMAAFEASFPYEPTRDQIEVSEAIKADLESDKPMDRLLCGDVGFGKTEVAMRAAAKMAFEGRQVAVLCPTTILCFQHYRTFRERFAAFPIRVEMLNRFVSAADAKRIQQDLADGKVDILIGTHQALGGKVEYAELGLVVIDEEQRFGVAHKEKLKKLRASVDVLSMSATPIPRTLHMSLAGLREISLIETPPKNRLAIETVVAPWNDELLRSSIAFELRRGGQVYLVHNRVESIDSIADRVRSLVPEARVGIGHGQMNEHELERVMLGFMEGRIDVLIATTIVENGLDVPNANTLIVHRADAFGLSQLYQLRGRVGRSDIPAYAYLLIPGKGEISEDARKRLQALEDFSELGSGFRIAAMDLELRGAGNILGGEQSGHIHDIGFEMYLKLLEETLQELQGQPSGTFEVRVDGLTGGGPAQLSRAWIDAAAERLVAYKRASRLKGERDLELYRQDLEDRFGRMPEDDEESLKFFEVLRVKLRAQHLAVGEVSLDKARLKFRPSPQTPLDPAKLMAWVREQKDATLTPDGTVTMPARTPGLGLIRQAQEVLGAWAKL
ncbi:MAG TPA: transcription-repair coupling factor [Holophagaceae bacterium]|jgi:transcription-repair coupling factor (superfamily II helicase)|nr:transcription-repair coupling factor [Holophagaceae bacterium]